MRTKTPAPAKSRARSRRAEPATKTINLALQGGGAHGAFAWGVLDYLLEDARLKFEGVSGTSAGSMNAVVMAYGLHVGGNEEARAALERFWRAVSEAGERYSPVKAMPWESRDQHWNNDHGLMFQFFKTLTNTFSPYQLNPNNFNPLKDILEQQIDFKRLNTC